MPLRTPPGRHRRALYARLAAAAALAVLILPWTGAAATPSVASLLPTCGTFGGITICSGEVPSFDGTLLDVDLSFPSAPGARHPLMVVLHGFGNDKHEWESTTDEADNADKWHWNSHWFAQHGLYVLAYTARGFRSEPPRRPDEPATPSGTSASGQNATIHLKSREFEVRDTQWLAALIATAIPDIDPNQVAVTGGSYGGGEGWLQASQADWTFPSSVDGSLVVPHLQVAVPKYPWTDLAYGLAPNGHGGGPTGTDIYESAQGRPAPNNTGEGNPMGVVKDSYAHGLFALGAATGVFEEGQTTTPSEEGPINIPSWFVRIVDQGDPYSTPTGQDLDPIVKQVRRGLTRFRGAYYQPESWQAQVGQREVAIFSISGWTDDLFPPIESFRQFKQLKRLDPLWPVTVGVADVGHPRAQNKPRMWHYLNDQAWQFLNAHIGGSHRQQTTVFSLPTTCANDGDPDQNLVAIQALTADSPEGLSNGRLTVDYAAAETLTSVGGLADPNGPLTDPLANELPIPSPGARCRVSDTPAIGGFTGVSQPLSSTLTYVGLGYVDIPYLFTGQTGQVDARVWDVTPSGQALLVTRGTYRLDVAGFDLPAGTLRLPLFGNQWTLSPGHRVRLDLTQVDQPFLRPSNPPSTLSFANPRLVLPLREAVDQTLVGGP